MNLDQRTADLQTLAGVEQDRRDQIVATGQSGFLSGVGACMAYEGTQLMGSGGWPEKVGYGLLFVAGAAGAVAMGGHAIGGLGDALALSRQINQRRDQLYPLSQE